MESRFPERHTGDLVKGRNSVPFGRYFVTCRCFGINSVTVADHLSRGLDTLQQDRDADIQCFTVMPDHVHVLLVLGERLTLSQAVGKFKACSIRTIRPITPAFDWQRNFFEHHVRPDESGNAYARYIFMNPYRAGLISRREQWSFWRCSKDVQFDFLSQLDEGVYPPEEWFEEIADSCFDPH